MKLNKNYYYEYKDQFNIYNLIRKINPNYRLYFNNKTKKFIIVNICNNFEICKEFYSFFENILQDLRFSKVENQIEIFNKMEINNENLKQKSNEKINEITNNLSREFCKISNRSSKINNSDINKIMGEIKC